MSSGSIKLGDFSALAETYHHRPTYSRNVLSWIRDHVSAKLDRVPIVADIGAGTGKLTEDLVGIGMQCVAVEPNDQMRAEGGKNPGCVGVTWNKGSGEKTGLADSSVDWVLMGSSFHWVDTETGLAEFRRILRPGGFFTAIWNPRDLERSELHSNLEKKIQEFLPTTSRRSSGSGSFTADLDLKLTCSGKFKECVFIEDRYELEFTRERYIGAWHSVNEIQSLAGPDGWKKILQLLDSETAGMTSIKIPYKTRSWSVQCV